MLPLYLRFAVASLLLGSLLTACGGDDNDTASLTPGVTTQTPNAVPSIGGPQQQPAPVQELSSQPVEPADGVIEVTASGTRFEQNYLHIEAGDAVTIRLTNEDSVPHSLRIAGIDGEFETEDDAVTTPEQVDPGQAGEVTFAPQADGAYTFRCDIHPQTMGGEIVVGAVTPIPAVTAVPTDLPLEEETPAE